MENEEKDATCAMSTQYRVAILAEAADWVHRSQFRNDAPHLNTTSFYDGPAHDESFPQHHKELCEILYRYGMERLSL